MSDLVYRLVLRARFESQEELEKAIRGLERLQIQGSQVNVNIGQGARQGAMGLETLARGALSAMYSINLLESAYMRLTMGQLMVERGQERLNSVIQKYGANSEEATEAAAQLEMQTKYLNLANQRASMSLAILITNMLLQTKVLNTATIASIARTAATALATAKDWLHNAALAAKATLLSMINPLSAPMRVAAGVGVAAAIGAGMAGIALTQTAAEKKQGGNINIETNITNTPDLGAAFDEAERQATYELRRHG